MSNIFEKIGQASDNVILEPDALRSFTIPKKLKTSRELLENLSLNSREYRETILPAITASYKDRTVDRNFKYTNVWLVHNSDLSNKYLNRRKELRQEGCSDKELQETFGFLIVNAEVKARDLCRSGIAKGNKTITSLGNSKLGVYLSRHADVVSADPLSYGSYSYLVVCKVTKGRVKQVIESRSNGSLDPTPNFDCHLAKPSPVDGASMSPQFLFESSQLYLYEYDRDFDLVDVPRHILPWAVVRFQYLGKTPFLRPPSLPKNSIDNAEQQQPFNSQSAVAEGGGGEVTSPDISATNGLTRDLRAEAEAATQSCSKMVGMSSADDGVVVWGGGLVWHEQASDYICHALMVSYNGRSPPLAVDVNLELYDCTSVDIIHDSYCSQLGNTSLSWTEDVVVGPELFCCYALRPSPEHRLAFTDFMCRLSTDQKGFVTEIEPEVDMLILPRGPVSSKLGLGISREQTTELVCIVIRPIVHQLLLQGLSSESSVQSHHEPMECSVSWQRPGAEEAGLHSFHNIVPLSNFCSGSVVSSNFDEMSDLQDNYVVEIARRNRAKAAAAQEAQATRSADPRQQQKSGERTLSTGSSAYSTATATPRAPFYPLPPQSTHNGTVAPARYPGDGTGVAPPRRPPYSAPAGGSCNWSFVNVSRFSDAR